MINRNIKIIPTSPCPCESLQSAQDCCLKSCCPECLGSPFYKGIRKKGWLLEKSLIRKDRILHMPTCSGLPTCPLLGSFKPKTVVVCGNGAVGSFSGNVKNPVIGDNVWDRIQETVSDFKKTPLGIGAGIPARHINCLHWTASTERLVDYYGTEKPGSMDEKILAPGSFLRGSLARKLMKSEIRLRKLECFNCTCEERLPPDVLASCGVITLNWDTAVEQLPHTVHLHGKINHPECLVLPNQDFMKLQPRQGRINQGFGSFHTARNWLDECENFLFWGCQFNDYDSILLTVLTSTTLLRQKRLNIFICNPSKDRLKEKLQDYFPLANFIDCLVEFKKIL
jgi:hypothetical protein